MSVYDLLRDAHPSVASLITASEARGTATYPLPFDVAKRPDWTPDLVEELADAMVYARSRILQLEPLMRRDSRARHAVLTLRAIEKRLARSIVELADLNEPWAGDAP